MHFRKTVYIFAEFLYNWMVGFSRGNQYDLLNRKESSIMQYLQLIIEKIDNVVWGPIMLTLLIGTGLFLTIRSGFLQFRRFGYTLKNTVMGLFSKDQHTKDASGVSPFQAVATALAGTIGTGSIAGLATAITAGGPGAVFWMWVSALLGMVTKYSEIVLSLKYREKNAQGEWVGGPMYYLQNGLKQKWLAVSFSIFAMIACLGTGNATQSNSIAGALNNNLGVPNWITGVVLTLIAGIVLLGGVRRIASVNEKLVPFMAVFYVLGSVVALIINAKAIPGAFALIFREAFQVKSALGGAAGYGIMKAMQFGFSRGVFSNEAGLGSAPMAHAASSTKDPVKQGLWGMFEVFFTTIIICTCSALVILTAGLWNGGQLDGASLSIASYDAILPFGIGKIVLTLSTILFSLSTILGWAYYGEVSMGYLTNKSAKAITGYRILYISFVFLGTVVSLDLVWDISSIMNGLMAIPNLIGILALSPVIIKATKDHFDPLKK